MERVYRNKKGRASRMEGKKGGPPLSRNLRSPKKKGKVFERTDGKVIEAFVFRCPQNLVVKA